MKTSHYFVIAPLALLIVVVGSIGVFRTLESAAPPQTSYAPGSTIEVVYDAVGGFLGVLPASIHSTSTTTTPRATESDTDVSREGVENEDVISENEPEDQQEPQDVSGDDVPESDPADTPLTPEEEIIVAEARARAATVNILCFADSTSPVHSTSGSGVMINGKGTILTNAHVAFPLLLEDHPDEDSVECVVRNGNPARARYTVELSYISPQWILANADVLDNRAPSGTGAHDFAILSITGAVDGGTLPETLPYVPIFSLEPEVQDTVIAAGYPASMLSSAQIQQNLMLQSAITQVVDVFTFNRTTIDVLSLGGISLAQQGSSGAAVVNTDGRLIGIIVTSTLEGDIEDRDVRAITIGHVTRSIEAQEGFSLAQYIASDIQEAQDAFHETLAPELREHILDVLE